MQNYILEKKASKTIAKRIGEKITFKKLHCCLQLLFSLLCYDQEFVANLSFSSELITIHFRPKVLFTSRA